MCYKHTFTQTQTLRGFRYSWRYQSLKREEEKHHKGIGTRQAWLNSALGRTNFCTSFGAKNGWGFPGSQLKLKLQLQLNLAKVKHLKTVIC